MASYIKGIIRQFFVMLKCKVNTNQHEKLIKKWFQLKVMCHIDLEGSGISISRCRRLCLLGRPQRSMLAINWPSLPRLLDSCSSCSSLAPQKQPVPGLTKCRNHYSKRVAANVDVCLWRDLEKWPSSCSFGLVWLINHGWKYCWLIWYERKILFVDW